MVALLQDGLAQHGIHDTLLAAGQFAPRGSSGARFAGGMIGDTVGGELGNLGSAVGVGVGYIAGGEAASQASGLPRSMLVGVSATTVYGMHAATRRSEPDRLLFAVPRDELTVHVHQRGMVRVLELVDDESDAHIELEGNRLPVTHSKDVIEHLQEPVR
ncbi:hypothetical protein CLV56_0748 [Mumia flava]|uniref:Uncharacterized protein n=2 Tax=Mumia flava TaxID=1348852 RepID=A0A0B2BJT3_9ACTN|nr:hypothetical protein CLV56_0748 [Mumia flava]